MSRAGKVLAGHDPRSIECGVENCIRSTATTRIEDAQVSQRRAIDSFFTCASGHTADSKKLANTEKAGPPSDFLAIELLVCLLPRQHSRTAVTSACTRRSPGLPWS